MKAKIFSSPHYDPESKHQDIQWNHPASPPSKKFKTQPSARKVMLTVFWGSQGPILEHYQERGTTVTSGRYCDMLQNELKPAIHKEQRERLSQGVLLHDNTCPHSAANTKKTLQELKFEALDNPPYSPDLAPSDFHLFGPLKEALRGHQFTGDDKMKEVVQKLSQEPATAAWSAVLNLPRHH
jgi:histone-lysine N-methyltransferase SETMAR